MVVRECCKGDDQSQWERGKFDPRHPKPPQPIVTKICVGDYVGDIYHMHNFIQIVLGVSVLRMRDFGVAPLCDSAIFFWGGGVLGRLPPGHAHRF